MDAIVRMVAATPRSTVRLTLPDPAARRSTSERTWLPLRLLRGSLLDTIKEAIGRFRAFRNRPFHSTTSCPHRRSLEYRKSASKAAAFVRSALFLKYMGP